MGQPYCINCGMRHTQRAGGDWECEIDSGTVMELQRKQIAALKAEVRRAKIEVLEEVLDGLVKWYDIDDARESVSDMINELKQEGE